MDFANIFSHEVLAQRWLWPWTGRCRFGFDLGMESGQMGEPGTPGDLGGTWFPQAMEKPISWIDTEYTLW